VDLKSTLSCPCEALRFLQIRNEQFRTAPLAPPMTLFAGERGQRLPHLYDPSALTRALRGGRRRSRNRCVHHDCACRENQPRFNSDITPDRKATINQSFTATQNFESQH
jgi:hypothetical protein